MIFNVVTVFNRKNGYSDQLHVCRSVNEYAETFQNQLNNFNLKPENVNKLDIRDYEIRKVGQYDDEQTVLIPLDKYEVVPFPPISQE